MNTKPELRPPSAAQEAERARARRTALGILRPGQAPAEAPAQVPLPLDNGDANAPGQWALALSGGGIRSATFCLGVLQALAKTSDPGTPASTLPTAPGAAAPGTAPTSNAAASTATDPSSAFRWPLLAQFDYLSTVSGGGYIGGFFSSLFVKGRLSGSPLESDRQTTQRAYEALREEPPGRIHRETNYDADHPGRTALAWLRDNGRYMAPSGAGDMLYAIAVAARNWFATQYVVGSLIIFMLALLQGSRWALASFNDSYRAWEGSLLAQARLADSLIWWSPSWALSGVLVLLATLPLGIAFWFSHPATGQHLAQRVVNRLNRVKRADVMGIGRLHDHLSAPPHYWTMASLLGLVLGVLLSGLGGVVWLGLGRQPLGLALMAVGLSTVLAVGWYLYATAVSRRTPQGSITLQRVLLTRWLADTLMVMMVLATLSAVETLAQTAWLWLSLKHGAVVSGVLAGLVWLLKEGATRLSDKPAGSFMKRLPVGLIAGLVGGTLWLIVAAGLDIALLQVAWPGGWANPDVLRNPLLAQKALGYATGALLLSATLAWVVGRFPGFLNLSTLQALYSSRIVRAYLGASNHARFTPEATGEARDVAEPIQGDSLATGDIYRNPLAPVHYVNVCVNQSVSPGEQLVQRDRKGKPLVVAPGGFYFDQAAYPLGHGSDETELAYPLSFGEWLGVSGAAFSTGLGRGTGLGMSLAMGFANVRLGRWWKGIPQKAGMGEHWFRRQFMTQAYLLDELRGLFYGDHRPYQYLSDGGHFENTAVYELLRTDRQRQVRIIVVCDCGCDPDYQFEDLANLTRLVRIDHGLEIRVNRRAHGEALLNQVFARPEDFRRGDDGKLPERSGRCAVMLDVLGTERSAALGVPVGALFARIILIKPTLLASVGVDIDQYHANHASFPQETTMDQFFDEAQWESYRQLGLRAGVRVFTADGMPGYPEKLWQVCMDGLPV